MSVTVVVDLKVEDYGKFEKVFAARANARAEAGIDVKPYRDIDNSNRVVAIGTVSSKEAFWGFMTSLEQQEAMKNAGVQAPPDVTFLEE
ncbi:hypothetical protein FIM04_04075 [SAR202 cluster bacterium AC-409-J13_OGT_754m]|nr:hypothetical protein [SAR202 cluster bacterium AC-409-J13_OGT_754m]